MAIDEVRIHPAIGVARMGNSDSDFFVGPELRYDRSEPAGGYKDAQCRIKRQAARFRVFGYENGALVRELTAADATIAWTVHLVNRKAAADRFENGGPRNPDVTGADRDHLVIDPGVQHVTGTAQRVVLDSGTFTVPGKPAVSVPLGEIRTDVDGHLLVMGGFGHSGSPDNHGLGSFADSDHWYDDSSDGSVNAKVTVDGNTFDAAGAWVVVGPPKFAPGLDNPIRLWDAIYDAHAKAGHINAPATPSYKDDIFPILKAAVDVQSVHDVGFQHPFSHPVAGSALVYNVLNATNSSHMPQLYDVDSSLQLRLTDTQLDLVHKWSTGTVTNDWDSSWGQGPPTPASAVTPGELDKAALENCVGGAFFPGIEAGVITTDASLYLLPIKLDDDGVPSFRIDPANVEPGDLTARMALPWQNDFSACADSWWPVPRPNDVNVAGVSGMQNWQRGFTTIDAWISDTWNKMGFVTKQGTAMVETDRCDAADRWVSLVTPSLTFHDVPQGPNGVTRKAARAVVFEVHSPSSITLNLTNPTDASLAKYTATPYVVPATGSGITVVRLWITYAAPNPSHSVTDSVTATCVETGQTWVIPITANAVPRKTAAAALVLDKSGSMDEDRGDGQGTKSQSLRDAAATFLDVMLPGDSMSLTAFDSAASVVKGLTSLGDPNDPFDNSRSDMRNAIYGSGLNPDGNTSIGNGIDSGRGTLGGASAQVQSLVVLTDGVENTPKWISDVAAQINQNTYSVGLGTAANISAAALETISGNHGGYLLITGSALGGDNQFLLKKYFLQILAGVSNAEVVLDPVGFINPGELQRVPFTVSDADNLVDVILTAEYPGLMAFALETPDGRLVDSATLTALGGSFVRTDQVSYFRVPMPLLIQPGRPSQVGTWHALVAMRGGRDDRRLAAMDQTVGNGIRYSINVHAWSDVSMNATAQQDRYTPGAQVTLHAMVTDSGIPTSERVSVWAEVRNPSGSTSTITLAADGDDFIGSFVASQAGDYSIRVRAHGTTSRGNAFTRERTLTASVWRGGDNPTTPPTVGDGDRNERWCAFLRCVLLTLSKNEQLTASLRRAGINLRDFIKCVELLCPDSPPRPHLAEAVSLPTDLARLIAELHRAAGAPQPPSGLT